MGNSSMITQTVKKWGNSLGINLPQSIAQQLDIKEGTVVKISAEGNKMILTTALSKYTLEELLENVTPDMQHDELDWGKPVGEENW